ncbi:hypothetical protein [Shewanella sp. ENK2]|uniref:hypothetical protein n=1 Tax=Shewanella sp. ENK2 TaxID=2775245 RepID=UPI003749235A
MNVIAPKVASLLALSAYDVESSPRKIIFDSNIKKHFKFKTSDVQEASTGGFFGEKPQVSS